MAVGRRARRVGRVVSNKMEKTIVVEVERFRRHRLYRKPVRVRSKLMAHDPSNVCQIGDTVEIEATRPLSRHKRWRLIEVLRTAELTSDEQAAAFVAADDGTEEGTEGSDSNPDPA